MKKIIATTTMLFLTGCGMNTQIYQVSDARKSETIIISKKKVQGNIHGLTIVGEGNIDGKATISLILHGGPYKTENLTGNIDFRWGGDWYSDSAEIHYEPISVNSGNLKLQYRFENI